MPSGRKERPFRTPTPAGGPHPIMRHLTDRKLSCRERGNQEISFGKVDDSICDTRGFLSSADSGCTWKLGRQKVKQEVGRGNEIFIIKRKIEHHEGNNWSLPIHVFRVIDWNFSLHCTRRFAPPSWYWTAGIVSFSGILVYTQKRYLAARKNNPVRFHHKEKMSINYCPTRLTLFSYFYQGFSEYGTTRRESNKCSIS